jgi:hypothetical protein
MVSSCDGSSNGQTISASSIAHVRQAFQFFARPGHETAPINEIVTAGGPIGEP